VVNASGPAGTGEFPLDGSSVPTLGFGPQGTASAVVSYRSAEASLREEGVALPDGSARIQFVVQPTPGEVVHSFSLELAPPPSDSTVLATDRTGVVAWTDGTLHWNVSGMLGQYPVRITVPSRVSFAPTPTVAFPPILSLPGTWNFSFEDPNGSAPFSVTEELSSQDTSNPASPLPSRFSTEDFLANNSIRYLLWPAGERNAAEIGYFGSTFGYVPAFANSEWVVLELR
jgi:hypothetical protein